MKNIAAALLTLCVSSGAMADTWGPPEGHTIANIRTYPDGSFVFQFTPALAAGCQYNDHSITSSTSPAFKLISALAISAFNTDKKVQIIYSGCSSNGGVNATGLIIRGIF